MELKKIKFHNKTGTLFKIIKEDDIKLNLGGSITLFGVENYYTGKIVKWVLNEFDIIKLRDIENNLLEASSKYGANKLDSKLIVKNGYKPMLITKIKHNCLANDIIKHENGDLLTFNDIKKNKQYNVLLILRHLSIKDETIYYNFEISRIEEKI